MDIINIYSHDIYIHNDDSDVRGGLSLQNSRSKLHELNTHPPIFYLEHNISIISGLSHITPPPSAIKKKKNLLFTHQLSLMD